MGPISVEVVQRSRGDRHDVVRCVVTGAPLMRSSRVGHQQRFSMAPHTVEIDYSLRADGSWRMYIVCVLGRRDDRDGLAVFPGQDPAPEWLSELVERFRPEVDAPSHPG